MQSLAVSWFFFFFIGLIFGGWTLWKRRPNEAVGVCAAISMLAPTWVYIGIEPYVFDVRMSLACVMLLAYCVHPKGLLKYPQHWLDAVVVGLIFVYILRDVSKGGDAVTVSLRAIAEWLVPYLAGRCTMLFRGSAAFLAPWFTGVAIVLGVGALIEAMTGTNVWEQAFGAVDDVVQRSRDKRYGILYRAVGPTRHPIFLGILFLLLIPFPVKLISQSTRTMGRVVGVVALLLIASGIIATVSRGPLIALVIIAVCGATIRWPAVRPFAAVLTIVFAATSILCGDRLTATFEKTDSTRGRSKLLNVNDEAIVYSGTRNRLLVWKVYGPLVLRGGMFGYGTAAVSSFPPNIPGLPASAKSAETLGIVDNSYLLLGLRFGTVGLTLFITLIAGAVFTAIAHLRSAGNLFYPDGNWFLIALASTLVGISFEIATVFLSYEFGFWLIFTCGMSAGIASLHRRLMRGADN